MAALDFGGFALLTFQQLTEDIHLYAFFGFVLLFGGFVLSMRALMLVFKRGVDG